MKVPNKLSKSTICDQMHGYVETGIEHATENQRKIVCNEKYN